VWESTGEVREGGARALCWSSEDMAGWDGREK
jgi:hypothetical protein